MPTTTDTLDSLARALRGVNDARLDGIIGRDTHAGVVAQLLARAAAAGFSDAELFTAVDNL